LSKEGCFCSIGQGTTNHGPTIFRRREVRRLTAEGEGPLYVKKITAELVNAYVEERLRSVQRGTVRRELDILRGVLKRAGLWGRMSDRVNTPAPGDEIGKALTPDEMEKIAAAARQQPEWQIARLAYTLAVNTTMRPAEMKSLGWRDIDWTQKIVTVGHSKTEKGRRSIPLNDEAFEAMRELQTRSKGLFGEFLLADWYVFAAETPQIFVMSWRKAWRSLLTAAGVAYTRFYNCRHTASTNLLQNPEVSEEVAKSIMGHASRKMLERYSHQRIEAKRAALDALPKSSATKLLQLAQKKSSDEG
jgi:integrase